MSQDVFVQAVGDGVGETDVLRGGLHDAEDDGWIAGGLGDPIGDAWNPQNDVHDRIGVEQQSLFDVHLPGQEGIARSEAWPMGVVRLVSVRRGTGVCGWTGGHDDASFGQRLLRVAVQLDGGDCLKSASYGAEDVLPLTDGRAEVGILQVSSCLGEFIVHVVVAMTQMRFGHGAIAEHADLLEMLLQVEVDVDVDEGAQDDDQETPHVREDVAVVGRLPLDPAPVPVDGNIHAIGQRDGAGDDG